ncbi:MAG: GtrA family protein [Rhizobiaceae bacterium]|nr:GtrA family protein [Rhizobiaceae bacterium]MCV0405986.1 GtrA family protein [Rhizobiaceae bacterium]
MKRFARFGLVGGVGFVVDATLLALLIHVAGLGPFAARAVSASLAILATWRLNRALTFGPGPRRQAVEGVRYFGVGTASGLLNVIVYAAVLLVWPAVPPLAALVAASAAAMAASFLGYSRLVFAR